MLTMSKEAIAANAYSAAKNIMQTHAAMGGHGYNQDPYSVMGQLTDLIALAVQAGVTEVLKAQYTNEEFEQDLGINS